MRRLASDRARRGLALVAGATLAVALVGVPAPALASPPTITVAPVAEATPTGSDVQLGVTAAPTDDGSLTYQWQYELLKGSGLWLPALGSVDVLGIGYTGADTSTLSIKNATSALNNIGLRVVVGSSNGGSTTSDSVSPIVGDPPLISSVSQTESRVVTGGSVHLTSTVPVGMTPLGYSWQVLRPQTALLTAPRWTSLTNSSTVSGARTGTLLLSNLTSELAKNSYRLVVTNPVGVDISDPVKIDVGIKPTVTNPTDQTAVDGNATLTSTVSGNPVPAVKWQRRVSANSLWLDVASENAATSFADGVATLKLSKLTTADSGAQYRVVASNVYGESAQSDPATLTVAGSKPTVSNPVDKLAIGGGVTLSVTATGDPAPTVTWQRRSPASGSQWEDLAGLGTSVPAGSSGITASLPLSGLTSVLSGSRYRAVAKNTIDTVVSDAATVTVGASPTVTNPADKIASAGAASLSVNVTGDPAPTVTWQRRAPGGSTWEDLSVSGTVSAGVATLPLSGLSSSSNGARYRAVVKNTVGQVVSDAATLTVGTAADVSNPAAQTAALGAATFSATVSGDPTPTTRWQVLGTSTNARWTNVQLGSGALAAQVGNLATLTLTGLTKDQNGNRYRVVATNGVDTPAVSDSAMLTVASSPLSVTNPASTVTGATNGAVSLSVSLGGDPAPTVQWQQLAPTLGATWTPMTNGSGVSGVTSATLNLSALTSARSGYRYRAVATNGSETATSQPALLTVL
ncbi:immunoglobulin domain-containing protein [Cryptosporangium sp. NPDC051539]|uniref:immunoglobulin domain-containing protein n=1 Tax=Cryptosporangium sp. NPDC051539 TaxID=3363962 RepID=UPI0037943A88